MRCTTVLARIRRHPAQRPMALGLSGLLLLLTWPGPALRVQAQQIARRPVAVLDFENRTRYGGDYLGRVAADTLALVLQAHGYDVRSREEVQRELVALELRPPYSPLELQKLGRSERVDVLEIFTGEILEVLTAPSAATVTVVVQVTDVETATTVNGAVVRETYAPKGFEGDVGRLVEQALERALERAVRDIAARQVTLRGRVMTVDRKGRVTISLGRRDGVKPGDEMVVLRPRYDPLTQSFQMAQVATLRVSEVTSDDAVAEVVGTPQGGLETGDVVRPLFRIERLMATPAMEYQARRKNFVNQVVRIALPVLAIFGLLDINRSRGGSRPPIVPSANAGRVFQARPGDVPFIRIRWQRGSAPALHEIGGWSIYRSTVPNFSASPETLIDVLTDRRAEMYDDAPIFFTRSDVEVEVTWLTQTGEEEGTYTADFNHLPIVPGETYFYRVRRIGRPDTRPPTVGQAGRSRQQQLVTPSEDDPERLLSDPSVPIGPITYVGLPTLSKPLNGSTDRRTDSVTFEWNVVGGGTEYVVEILADPQGRTILWRSPTVVVPSVAGLVTQSLTYDRNQPGFFTLQPRTVYYWRVGTRNSDPQQLPPEPLGYVYSETWSFETAETPPGTP